MCNGSNRIYVLHFSVNLFVLSFSFSLSCLQLLYFQLKISNGCEIYVLFNIMVPMTGNCVMNNKNVIHCKLYVFKTYTKIYGILLCKCLHDCTCHEVKTVNRVISAFTL